MTESKNFQKIKINKISLNQSTSLSKNFYQDQYYLDVLINNKYSQQSSPIKINKFYESYDIDSEISFSEELDTIFFKFCSQKTGTPIYQGSFTTLPSDLNKKGAFEYDCDIRNSNKEKITINFTYINNLINSSNTHLKRTNTNKNNEDSFEIFNNYNNYLNEISKQKKEINDNIKRVSASNSTKSDVSLLELAKGKNAILFNDFVKNVDYIKAILNVILDFIFWKDPYKTFSILSVLTIFILYTNFFILILSILLMILFHLSYRDSMEETFSFRNYSHNYSSNFQVIMWIMEITNNSIDSLENLFAQMQNNSTELFKEIYINLLKLLLWNIPLFLIINYAGNLIDFKYIVIISLWAIILLQYPPFKAFMLILIKLIISIIKDFGSIGEVKKERALISNEKLVKIAEIIVPFFNLGKEIYTKSAKDVLKKMNNAPEIVIVQDKNDENKLKQMLKYEIYEKQRWKIVTWSSDLKEGDGASWVKKGNNKNIFFDKNKLELPGKEYEWKNNWEVEISANTDKEGWEYAKSFDDDVWKKNDKNCSVRRRKWVKYAGLK
jgi:hypothetical protein